MTSAERVALIAEIVRQAPPLTEGQRRAVRRLAPRAAEPERAARRPHRAA